MPELPEVENTLRYLLEAQLPGRSFTEIRVGWANSLKRPGLEDFVLGLQGRCVKSVKRRGKYLLLSLDRDNTLVLHLGMTGKLRIYPQEEPVNPTTRHIFSLDDQREMRFIDPRKFGKLWLVDQDSQVMPGMGPEPLEEGFTPELLGRALAGRKAPIKALLLEQSIVAGLGNLYVDESLYLSGIHPMRSAAGLDDAEVGRLRDAIVAALTSALQQYDAARATGWPDPPHALSTWTIPRKIGAPCVRCGGSISAMRVRGRGTYFCGECQT